MAKVTGVDGETECETYLVNILLLNGITFYGVRVTKGRFVGAQVLIGMDIMVQGDFAVSNHGGKTKFSFRLPSEGNLDFVVEHNRRNAIGPTHGPGKRSSGKRKR